MLRTAIDYLTALYDAHGTFYRTYWTLIQAGCAAVIAYATDKPGIFPIVLFAAVVISSEARKALDKRA